MGCGIYVYPWLTHVNVWQKPLQYCKVISLQLIKINGKKKKNSGNYFPHLVKIHCRMLTFFLSKQNLDVQSASSVSSVGRRVGLFSSKSLLCQSDLTARALPGSSVILKVCVSLGLFFTCGLGVNLRLVSIHTEN